MTVPYTPPAVTPESLAAHALYLEKEGDKHGAKALNDAAKRMHAEGVQSAKDDVVAAAIFAELFPADSYRGINSGNWRAAAQAARKAVLDEQLTSLNKVFFNRHITL